MVTDMGPDTLKLAMIGGAGLLIGMLFFGGGKSRGRRDPGVEATLESMRISSTTNIAYGNIGVESQRVQAALAAQKDTNRTSIQIAANELATQRHAVNKLAETENYRIATDKSKFYSQLNFDLDMFKRWIRAEDKKLGKQISFQNKTDARSSAERLQIEKIRSKTVGYAARSGVAVQLGGLDNARQAQEQNFLLSLLSQSPGMIESIVRSGQSIYNSFGGVNEGYAGGSGAGEYGYRRNSRGYPGGSPGTEYIAIPGRPGGTTGFEEGDPTGAQIGTNIASGAAAGTAIMPGYGTAIGAAAGAGSSFS